MPKVGGDESMAPKPKAPFKSASSLELDETQERLMDGWLMHGLCWDGIDRSTFKILQSCKVDDEANA